MWVSGSITSYLLDVTCKGTEKKSPYGWLDGSVVPSLIVIRAIKRVYATPINREVRVSFVGLGSRIVISQNNVLFYCFDYHNTIISTVSISNQDL